MPFPCSEPSPGSHRAQRKTTSLYNGLREPAQSPPLPPLTSRTSSTLLPRFTLLWAHPLFPPTTSHSLPWHHCASVPWAWKLSPPGYLTRVYSTATSLKTDAPPPLPPALVSASVFSKCSPPFHAPSAFLISLLRCPSSLPDGELQRDGSFLYYLQLHSSRPEQVHPEELSRHCLMQEGAWHPGQKHPKLTPVSGTRSGQLSPRGCRGSKTRPGLGTAAWNQQEARTLRRRWATKLGQSFLAELPTIASGGQWPTSPSRRVTCSRFSIQRAAPGCPGVFVPGSQDQERWAWLLSSHTMGQSLKGDCNAGERQGARRVLH